MNYQWIACSGSHCVDGGARFEVGRVVFIAVCGWAWRDERRLWGTKTTHRVRRRVVHPEVCHAAILIDSWAWAGSEDYSTQTHIKFYIQDKPALYLR